MTGAKFASTQRAWSPDSACGQRASATKAGKLSGGNLQKLILGREILEDAAAMVVEQPTRGLDVGAIESIWAELLAANANGVKPFSSSPLSWKN